MRTELFLAWRYLKPKRNAVSLITVSSILGVTLGVAGADGGACGDDRLH